MKNANEFSTPYWTHTGMEGATQKAISPKHLKTLCNLYPVLDRASKSNFSSVSRCHRAPPRVPVTVPCLWPCWIISLLSPSCRALKCNPSWLLASSFLLENLAVPACVRSTAQSLLINWKFGGSGARKELSAFVRRNKEVSGQWFATEENQV